MLTDKDLDLQRTGGVRERCADISASRAVAASESVPEVAARAEAIGEQRAAGREVAGAVLAGGGR